MEGSAATASEQQQPQVQPKQEAVARLGHRVQAEEANGGKRRTSNSSSDSPAPSRQKLGRSVRNPRRHDRWNEKAVAVDCPSKCALIGLKGAVSLSHRALRPQSEDRRIGVAMKNRDAWIMKMLMEQTGLEAAIFVQGVTRRNTCCPLAIVNDHAGRYQHCSSCGQSDVDAEVQLWWHTHHPQKAADGLVSAPAKACVDIASGREAKYQGCLKPSWREGYVVQTADRSEPEILGSA